MTSLIPAPAPLYQGICDVLLAARTQVRQTVNTTMVQAYWQIGRLIVEDEQGGEKRAEYGKAVLQELSRRLTAEFGQGFTLANLRNFRQFYLGFSLEEIRYTACSELSWSHFRCLMRVENKTARTWYANEAATHWIGRFPRCITNACWAAKNRTVCAKKRRARSLPKRHLIRAISSVILMCWSFWGCSRTRGYMSRMSSKV